ncbi:hypothetical protein FIU83_13665 [Halomonas sp. THAF5a]|uniref:hypothetical protein n=1 Tax=Halomonas sp. THAF5a TaxID=2587844 RepID=UPI001269771B|nr:hypothetical protein [Halomonas sp. THAF5a]QFU02686.1 hypothetical protein FIU83_13665 [Halomonas sp. THAF5a]
MNRLKSQWWRCRGTFGVSLIGASLVLSAPLAARAATVATDFSSPVFQHSRQLSDHELAQLRGKAVNSREVLFFGVEMSMDWSTAAGEKVHARANLGFDMASGQPSPTFSSHITATTPEEYAAYRQSTVGQGAVIDGGTANGTGVVQLVQAGGDFNSANNAFWIDVGHEVGRGEMPAANNALGMTTPGGAQVSIDRQSGRLGMTLDLPGAGLARQEIVSRRGLRQSIQLSSNRQQVRNMTRLRIQLGEATGATSRQDMQRMLESIRVLERIQ